MTATRCCYLDSVILIGPEIVVCHSQLLFGTAPLPGRVLQDILKSLRLNWS